MLDELIAKGTKKQSDAVMAAMLKMHKLDIAGLQAAFDNA
jgi:predicted 3-demethylubiquinone-9 3-methyltransferase (glyoxalase superfamily)